MSDHNFWTKNARKSIKVSKDWDSSLVSIENLNVVFLSSSWAQVRYQRWPESLFHIPTPLLFHNFWIRVPIRVRLFLKFQNPTPVQTPVTIIDPTVIYPCFYLRNDRIDSCNCQMGKVTLDSVSSEISDFTPCTHAQTSILNFK